ncbi:CDP-diacylglycerol--glycerol-3-phosphate 3-phosphatidyltransferase [Eggerthella guodeyinii]|uniref:CDP-diacylglycerol--glycerol-3-phosphate 3-phosphatidyltransferase n=1 Tax=Eggerthella guodeyinii TaxID=2690837 RepID=A0A6L7IQP8_9ACTN|nr:CDP-diacylglycerol--glycerol-3-phosphate 3-phosphatidyltransferase [Eggerthella guodeyinii]QOS69848.1 CDP-diacylglycerol--glycerol-3-phosphate 3-phosphatidyltransferase [Eggerthella guodeyinii]
MTQGPVHEKLWTPANVVTLLRICLVPVFVVAIISPWPEYFPFWPDAEASKSWIAAGIFILLAATDGLDGYLARSRGEVTNFGKFIDPLADKILVAAALLALIELGVLPSWVALVILTREFIVSGIRMVAASQGVVIAASWYGKAKTVTQIVAIVLFIIKDSVVIADPEGVLHNPLYLVSWLAMLIAVALTIISMLDYFVKAKEILGFTPSGKRAKRAAAAAGEAAPEADATDGAGEHALSAEEAAGIAPEALDELAGRVLEAARAAGKTVGTAESLTGGLIAATLTDVPGSSDVVRGGIVSYSSDVKRDVLGVGRETLALCGAVSEETACAMAEGARRALACDVAVSVTGIAGPGGAEPGKPVGTVWIGRADAALTCARCCHFPGTRDEVRLLTVRAALEFALEALEAR